MSDGERTLTFFVDGGVDCTSLMFVLSSGLLDTLVESNSLVVANALHGNSVASVLFSFLSDIEVDLL